MTSQVDYGLSLYVFVELRDDNSTILEYFNIQWTPYLEEEAGQRPNKRCRTEAMIRFGGLGLDKMSSIYSQMPNFICIRQLNQTILSARRDK